MKTKKILLNITGVLNLLFAVFHLMFPKLFNWEKTLSGLDNANIGIIKTFNFSGFWQLLAMGIICFFMKDDLIKSRLGKAVLMYFASFWFLRAILEFVYFWQDLNIGIVILCGLIGLMYSYIIMKKS